MHAFTLGRLAASSLVAACVYACGTEGATSNATGGTGATAQTDGAAGASGASTNGGSSGTTSGSGGRAGAQTGGATSTGGGTSGGGMANAGGVPNAGGSTTVTLPKPTCTAATSGGSTSVTAPRLLTTLKDRWEEAWLASPAVADLDHDGKNEIIVPRGAALVVWHADGSLAWKFEGATGRIWSSAVVADLTGDTKLEVAFAARDQVFVLDSLGNPVSGFPVTWEDEMRSLAAGDVDGDGHLDLVAAPAHGSPTDVMNAWHADGSVVTGFPPNATGTSGCAVDNKCYLAGCYDQNVALGDLDDDGKWDIVVPHDDAYASFHSGTGVAFDANAMFPVKKTPGVRYLHDLALAQQGWANDETTALQAHFTNTAPAIADIDGDQKPDIILLASVQNAAQTDREKGVGLWALHRDASRLDKWQTPFHASGFLSGLWDYGNNIVAITNQVTVADIDPSSAGPELLFPGFDGHIHAVRADATELWSAEYTTDATVATGGVVVGDLSGDGVPEVVFNSYGTTDGTGALVILDAGGKTLHTVPLPRRGAMPVPTLADVDGNGTLEVVVSLKDAEDKVESVRVYTVDGSSDNCLPWPTGRANLLRNGWVK